MYSPRQWNGFVWEGWCCGFMSSSRSKHPRALVYYCSAQLLCFLFYLVQFSSLLRLVLFRWWKKISFFFGEAEQWSNLRAPPPRFLSDFTAFFHSFPGKRSRKKIPLRIIFNLKYTRTTFEDLFFLFFVEELAEHGSWFRGLAAGGLSSAGLDWQPVADEELRRKEKSRAQEWRRRGGVCVVFSAALVAECLVRVGCGRDCFEGGCITRQYYCS